MQQLNIRCPEAMNLLSSRRSGSAKAMTGPGPSETQLEKILAVAARVPDHGKLVPWRFIVFEGDARTRIGQALAERWNILHPDASEAELDIERGRFMRAPTVIAIVNCIDSNHKKIPVWEQQLSAGAVCQNMLLASHALGFVANWITEWCAYDRQVLKTINLSDNEHIAGFIYIGQSKIALADRPRPRLTDIVTYF